MNNYNPVPAEIISLKIFSLVRFQTNWEFCSISFLFRIQQIAVQAFCTNNQTHERIIVSVKALFFDYHIIGGLNSQQKKIQRYHVFILNGSYRCISAFNENILLYRHVFITIVLLCLLHKCFLIYQPHNIRNPIQRLNHSVHFILW